MSGDHGRLEQTASAIEDLLYMGAIRLADKQDEGLLSPKFSIIVSNMMSSMNIENDAPMDDIKKLMYYSILIYMNEQLKMPKPLMMAIGNDLEKNREGMESGELMNTYVEVLTELWTRNSHRRESGR